MNVKCLEIKEYIKDSVSELFQCKVENDLLHITTPFFYPDGDDIELFVEIKNEKIYLSDMGETVRYLNTYAFDMGTGKRKRIFEDIVKSHNIRANKGLLYAIIKNPDNIFEAIINISQAMIRISDLLYTSRVNSIAAFEEEVRSLFDDNQINYEQDYAVSTTHAAYNFEFAIETKKGINLLKLFNKPKNKQPNIDKVVKTWFDIQQSSGKEFPKENRITLLDDVSYPWKPKQYSLIEKLSTIHKWTQKDDLITEIKNVS